MSIGPTHSSNFPFLPTARRQGRDRNKGGLVDSGDLFLDAADNIFKVSRPIVSRQLNRTCSPNEDVTSYSHAIRRLATKAYPGQLLDDKILVDMFIKGLPTQAMKRHVYLAKPSTLAEAINCAVVYEAFDKPSNTENSDRYRKPANAGAYEKIASVQNSTAQNSVVGRQNNDALSTIMATLSTLTKTVDELQKSVGSSTRPQYQRPANYAGRVECFNCRKMGHYAKDCYQAKRPAQNYGRGRNQGQPQGQSPIQCRDFSNVSNTPTTQLN